ncbi:hypothetical protein CLNEO_14860 [Anaerotignum neopropionicum]|uniref:ParB/Sulfiredoxin domain-containing protein n=1 Tax=Anaerotignum neopropionicum TaxID=36847 RepID=A0A136WEM0_9FIRM|nr:hypothetical protein [Anaerotignum neopropionicum]KXL52944.1 hypothetical protein CLNEO_14860 [Anaerotignum neopropionicum]
MESKTLQTLKIDKDFKNLICPLENKEYLQLEANLLADGCGDPIITWNGFIIDGHNRYELCIRHQIPYTVVEMKFNCRESVISWICANQLGIRNITVETRKFLIGMQYESEKLSHDLKNAQGKNQYDKPESELSCGTPNSKEETRPSPSGHVIAQRIAQENQIAEGTVLKYAIYTRALEAMGQKVPEMVPKILSGRYKISHNNVVDLSLLTSDEIKKVGHRMERNQQPFVQYNSTRQKTQNTLEQASSNDSPSTPSVKDMPAFDPDAAITALTLTIPSWVSSIKRTRMNTDFDRVSFYAKDKLTETLIHLQYTISKMLSAIKEEE